MTQEKLVTPLLPCLQFPLLCRDWHLAQDLTQIALIKVHRAWRRINNDDPLTYAKKVLFRAYLDHRRRRGFTDMTVASPPEPDAVQDSRNYGSH